MMSVIVNYANVLRQKQQLIVIQKVGLIWLIKFPGQCRYFDIK